MIHSFRYCIDHVGEVGKVTKVRDSLVTVSGMSGVVVGEGVTFADEKHGVVMSIESTEAEVLVFSRNPIQYGTKAARTGQSLSLSSGDGLLGHVINALGQSLVYRRDSSKDPEKRAIDGIPLGIAHRKRVSRFLTTGTTMVDLLLPLGHGQRELIIGARKTGKTQFALTAISAQASTGAVGIWCAIGKRASELKRIADFFHHQGVMKQCIVVAANAGDSVGEMIIAPSTAMTLAEYFRDSGRDVLLVIDDLTTHAKYWREVALLSGIFPGRESYPGDMFYAHSRLLERGGCFVIDGKENAITVLPIAESIGSDLTGYIQTNVMSMTDGHIFFDGELFAEGHRPAINIAVSVTRVGRQTQLPGLRSANQTITTLLKKHKDAQRFLRFGPELTPLIKEVLTKGDAFMHFCSQSGHVPIPLSLQMYLLARLWNGEVLVRTPEEMIDVLSASQIGQIERGMKQYDTFLDFVKYIDTLNKFS